MSPDTIAILIAVVTMGAIGPGVLVVLLLTLNGQQGRRSERLEDRLEGVRGELRGELAEISAGQEALREDLHSLTERVARIEGVLMGPWRPPEQVLEET